MADRTRDTRCTCGHPSDSHDDLGSRQGNGGLRGSPMTEQTRVHRLKTWPEFYEHVLTGAKPFEVRRDDRGFQPGDVLHLREYDQRDGYTGRSLYREVTYLFDLGCPLVGAHGFVVMGLAAVDEDAVIPVIEFDGGDR